ncbi:helix-turn-helix domain-containing protein [Williamsia sp. 1135]|uniref:helix-turn-helix domain-containing protein n=1 Tax=Williamsia sp. 1135 TaxID=1889262 RepID=UPI000A115B40|nr:helix-turn-helix domain-containing protein [Williamsia sp. 1135]ORM37957.1 hypothetical protein BFL43_02160 [Williamsia sp. 1135]
MTEEIAPASGVLVSEQVAKDLVVALDELAKLADRQGARLSPRLEEIRRNLLTHSGTHDSVRMDEFDVVDLLMSQPDSMFDVSTAAQQLGLSNAGVRYLIRTHRIAATFSSGRWFIPTDEVAAHRAARRAAGKL